MTSDGGAVDGLLVVASEQGQNPFQYFHSSPDIIRMVVRLNGEMVYLWRAVDHEGEVLESYVHRKRDKSAALAFMKKTLKRYGRTETIGVDGLVSYPAAMREQGNLDRREMGQSETSCHPTDSTLA